MRYIVVMLIETSVGSFTQLHDVTSHQARLLQHLDDRHYLECTGCFQGGCFICRTRHVRVKYVRTLPVTPDNVGVITHHYMIELDRFLELATTIPETWSELSLVEVVLDDFKSNQHLTRAYPYRVLQGAGSRLIGLVCEAQLEFDESTADNYRSYITIINTSIETTSPDT